MYSFEAYAMHTAISSEVTITTFSPCLAQHFYRLNAEWLQRYFRIESSDEAVLRDPVKHVIDPGGEIWFAQLRADVVGTCALIPAATGARRLELAKMGVTPSAQGLGIGRRLIEAALTHFSTLEGRELFLETSSRLKAAIRLYESVGFKHRPHPNGVSSYERADTYMVFEPGGLR